MKRIIVFMVLTLSICILAGCTAEPSANPETFVNPRNYLGGGGTLIVFGPTSGDNTSLDADKGILIDGGYLFAVGSLGMVETPASNSKQNALSYAQTQTISANTILSLTDDSDTPIFSITAEKTCQSIILSCPELTTGKSFKLYGGDTQLCSFTITTVITSVGSQDNIGNPGGFGGGMGPGRR